MKRNAPIRQFIAQLLAAWRAKGHAVGVDTHLRLHQLVEDLPDDTPPEAFKTLFAPLLASNEIEQKELYALIDRFAQKLPTPKPWWQQRFVWLAAGLLIVVFGFLVWMLYWKNRPNPISTNHIIQVQVDVNNSVKYCFPDSIVPSNQIFLSILKIDSSLARHSRASAHSSDINCVQINGLKAGIDTIPITLEYKVRSEWFAQRRDPRRVTAEQTFFLVVAVTAAQGVVPDSFKLPDSIPFKIHDHRPDISSLKPQEIPPFSLDFAYWEPNKTARLLYWGIFLVILDIFLKIRRHRRQKREREKQKTDPSPTPIRRRPNEKPPYSWQLRIPEVENIRWDDSLAILAQQMRGRSETEQQLFHAGRTVQATIRQGGRVSFRYAQPTRPKEYLLLIDTPSPHDHRAQLFDLLYREFARGEVLIERFYFRHDPLLCWNERYPQGISLRELQHRYNDHVLLLVGPADRLLSPDSGKRLGWTKVFDAWKSRHLLTTRPMEVWGDPEAQLATTFQIAPANLYGLKALLETGSGGDKIEISHWMRQPERFPRALYLPEQRSPEAMFAALEAEFVDYAEGRSDERLLLWLAACAISPVLHWDATLFFGEWCDDQPSHPLLSIENLERLNRLSWFSEGSMPENARRALLDWLAAEQPERLLQLRLRWQALLEANLAALQQAAREQSAPPFEESAAYDDLRMTLLVNELALDDLKGQQMPPETRRQLERELQERSEITPPDFIALELLQQAHDKPAPAPEQVFEREAEQAFPPFWSGWRWLIPLILLGMAGLWCYNSRGTEGCASPSVIIKGQTYCLTSAQDSLTLYEYMFCHKDSILVEVDSSAGRRYTVKLGLRSASSSPDNLDSTSLSDLLRQIGPLSLSLARDTEKLPAAYIALYLQNIEGQILTEGLRLIHDNPLDSASFYKNIPIAYWNHGARLYNAGLRDSACVYFKKLGAWPWRDSVLNKGEKQVLNELLRACTPNVLTAEQIKNLPTRTLEVIVPSTGRNPGSIPTTATEESAWQTALTANTEAAYEIYLFAFPDGAHAFDAMVKIAAFDPMQLVAIRGGSYTMGCTAEQQDCGDDEKPAHRVQVSDYCIGRYEVTQRQWRDVMGSNPSYFKNCEQCPVENVSWDDIQTFLQKLNARYPGHAYRLPTEAEWEYAARERGQAVLFGNGKNVADPKEINFDGSESYKKPYSRAGEYREKTTPVGTFAPNALGLYDMSGNVWEWCSDWYGAYTAEDKNNPLGADKGVYRVLRGGSLFSGALNCRVSSRGNRSPTFRLSSYGFRLALQ